MSTSELSQDAPERPEDIEAVPVRHPGRWIVAAIVLVIAASIVRSVIVDKGFEWHVVGHYLFDPRILRGAWTTIYLTFLSMVIGIALGVIARGDAAVTEPDRVGRGWFYIWFFRGTPLLVQVLFWYNIAVAVPGDLARGAVRCPALIHESPTR